MRCGDAEAVEELRQDVFWEVRLALVEIAGEQVDRQQAAPFQLEQDSQQPVGILAAGDRHQPAVAGAQHAVELDRLAHAERISRLRSLLKRDRARHVAKQRMAVGGIGKIGIVDGHVLAPGDPV